MTDNEKINKNINKASDKNRHLFLGTEGIEKNVRKSIGKKSSVYHL